MLPALPHEMEGEARWRSQVRGATTWAALQLNGCIRTLSIFSHTHTLTHHTHNTVTQHIHITNWHKSVKKSQAKQNLISGPANFSHEAIITRRWSAHTRRRWWWWWCYTVWLLVNGYKKYKSFSHQIIHLPFRSTSYQCCFIASANSLLLNISSHVTHFCNFLSA